MNICNVFNFLDFQSLTFRAYLGFSSIVVVGEIIFFLMFCLVSKIFKLTSTGNRNREIFKGILERIMLSVGISHGVATVVILFGALKVATKLSLSGTDHKEDDVRNHNDYFIIGNILSATFALVYAILAAYFKLALIKL
jgi:hypothetical protein